MRRRRATSCSRTRCRTCEGDGLREYGLSESRLSGSRLSESSLISSRKSSSTKSSSTKSSSRRYVRFARVPSVLTSGWRRVVVVVSVDGRLD